MYRERWLTRFVYAAQKIFTKAGYELPIIEIAPGRCSIGLGDGLVQLHDRCLIFIDSTVCVQFEVVTLLLRCVVGLPSHPAACNRVAKALGLKSCLVPELTDEFNNILAELGPYPEK